MYNNIPSTLHQRRMTSYQLAQDKLDRNSNRISNIFASTNLPRSFAKFINSQFNRKATWNLWEIRFTCVLRIHLKIFKKIFSRVLVCTSLLRVCHWYPPPVWNRKEIFLRLRFWKTGNPICHIPSSRGSNWWLQTGNLCLFESGSKIKTLPKLTMNRK